MIHEFIETCRNKGEKPALIDGSHRVTFLQLLNDVYKMANLLRSAGIPRDSKVLLLVLPSYRCYVLLLACIYCGINVVVMDSYKDIGRIRRVMEGNGIQRVFCTRTTALLKGALGRDTVFIDVSAFYDYPPTPSPVCDEPEKVVLTTFTSGTTGEPKPIHRSIRALKKQIEVVSGNISVEDSDVAYVSLPIYVLFVLFKGVTCVITPKIRVRELEQLGVNTVLAPIAKLIRLKGSLPCIKKLYLGGAALRSADGRKLLQTFPNARATYVYGASECVLMAVGDLEHYLAHDFALQYVAQGVQLRIDEPDENGVGCIVATADVVLTPDGQYVSNDIGYMDQWGVHIVGRRKYSAPDCYQYVMDERLLIFNPNVRKGFSFVHDGRRYFCYEGKLSVREPGIIYIKKRKLPMDPKHRTKLDYGKMVEQIQKR